MLRDETAKLLMMIQGAYPNYKPDNKTVTVNTWFLALSDIPFGLAEKAFLAYLRADTKGFAPTPGQLIAFVRELNTPQQLNELEAWSLVEKAIRKGYFEDTPKTRTSIRDIPLTAAITEHIEAQRKYWGFKVVRMDQYLFCNENGDPISRERIQGEIDRIIKRIKSDGYDFPRITSHVFRHTFATRAIEAGMPPQVLKTILGHSSLAMTMDLYSHVLPDTKADEMQKIANVF